MPLWDDATQAYTGQQPSQDSSSLWGWLTSLFSPRPMPGSGLDSTGLPLYPYRGGDPRAPASPTTTSPNMTPEQVRAAAGLPTWGGMSGVSASMQVAPPSMYTAANPQQQAAWQQASTPQGYAAALGQIAQQPGPASAAVPSVLRPPPAAMMPPPPKPMPPPVITGPGTATPLAWMPPAGGSQGWAGIQGLPGVQSDVRVQPFRNLRNTDVQPMPPSSVAPSPAVALPPAPPPAATAAIPPPRTLSDADIQNMSYGDVLNFVGRSDLTYAQRMALQRRLNTMNPYAPRS